MNTDATIKALQTLAANLQAAREHTAALIAHSRESSRTLTATLGAAIDATDDAIQEALGTPR